MSHSRGDTAVIVDGLTYAIVARIPAGNAHELAVTRDGGTVIVGNRRGIDTTQRGMAVVDVATRRVTRRLPTGDCSPHDIRLSRDDSIVWTACAPIRAIVGISVATGAMLERWETSAEGSWMLTTTPNDEKIYVPNLEGKSVSIIDRQKRTTRVVRFGGGLIGGAVTPDNREVWVSDMDSSLIHVLDARTDSLLATFNSGGKMPVRIRFVPDGSKAVITNGGSSEVTMIDRRSRRVVGRVRLPAGPKVLDVSSDGRRAVVSLPASNQIAVIHIERAELLAIVAVPGVPDGVAWIR